MTLLSQTKAHTAHKHSQAYQNYSDQKLSADSSGKHSRVRRKISDLEHRVDMVTKNEESAHENGHNSHAAYFGELLLHEKAVDAQNDEGC